MTNDEKEILKSARKRNACEDCIMMQERADMHIRYTSSGQKSGKEMRTLLSLNVINVIKSMHRRGVQISNSKHRQSAQFRRILLMVFESEPAVNRNEFNSRFEKMREKSAQ